MPNLDAANIAFQMIKVLADALPVGPILIGAARPAHILTPSVTARGIVNMTAVAVGRGAAGVGKRNCRWDFPDSLRVARESVNDVADELTESS